MTQAFVNQHLKQVVIEPLTPEEFAEIGVVHIGNNRAISVYNYKAFTNISIREYYRKDGKIAPARRGINLTPSQWTMMMKYSEEINARLSECQAELNDALRKQQLRNSKYVATAVKRLQNATPKTKDLTSNNCRKNMQTQNKSTINLTDSPQVISYEPSIVTQDPDEEMMETPRPMQRQNAMYYKQRPILNIAMAEIEESQNMDTVDMY